MASGCGGGARDDRLASYRRKTRQALGVGAGGRWISRKARVSFTVLAGAAVVMAMGILSPGSAVASTASLSLSASSGPPGWGFTATAAGFAAGEAVDIYFGGANDDASCTTNSGGLCEAIAYVPDDPAGSYTVEALGASGDSATTTFTVTAPELSLEQSSGPPGSTIADASGFGADDAIVLSFGAISQGILCTTTSSGSCLGLVTVPDDPGGAYTVTALGDYGATATATFMITQAMYLAPNEGPPGTQFSANLSGFGADEPVEFSFGGASPTTGCTTDHTGDCVAELTAPIETAGSFTVTAQGENSGFQDSATFTITTALSLSPSSGYEGSSFTATLAGFAAGEAVEIYFGGTDDDASCTTDSSGSCSTTADVPDDPAGSYTVEALGASGDSATATYTVVTPTLSLSPGSGPQGSSFTATLANFAVGEAVEIYFGGADDDASCITDSSGGCSTTAVVPADSGGSYTVEALGASGDSAIATFTVTPTLSLSPGSSQQGTSFTATVTGFAAAEAVEIYFGGADDGASCTTDSSGDCSTTAVVPDDAVGSYTVKALGASGDAATANFVVVAQTLSLSPGSGPQGSSFTATVAGFKAGEAVEIYFNGADDDASCTTDSSGDCSTTAGVPVGNGGIYTVEALGASGDSASAGFTLTPHISLGTSSGPPGTGLLVFVTGFGDDEPMYFSLGDVFDDEGNTTTYGSYLGNVIVPEEPGGSYTVIVRGVESDDTASATYTITQALYLAPDSGPPGTQVDARVEGFAADEPVEFSFGGASPTTGCTTDSTGGCTAQLTVPSETAGSYTVTAQGENSGYETSATFTVTISATSTALSSSLNPSTFGQSVTFTASVSPSDGGGSVGFYADGSSSPISGCGSVPLALVGTSEQATCTTSALAGGTHAVSATYSGDSAYAASAGSLSGGQVVSPAPLALTVAGTQTYGMPSTRTFAVTTSTGFENGDTLASLSGTLSCTSTVSPGAAAGPSSGTISCSGLSDPNYDIAYVDGGMTIVPATLTVTASSASATYGAPPPTVTPSYSGFVNGDTVKSLTTAPTCSTTETASSPVGTYPTSCSGAVDTNYLIGYVDGTVTVGAATTSLAYTGTTEVTTPAALVPAAALSSSAIPCETGQIVTFTLSSNPATGAAGTYTLEAATTGSSGTATGAAISTSSWLAGSYTITASYAGTANCVSSQGAGVLAVAVPGTAAVGAGTYKVSGAGTVSMGFVVAQVPHTSTYAGQLSIVNGQRWWFAASVTSYTKSSSSAGNLSGNGTLSWWNPALNHGHGGWQVAATSVTYTAAFTATAKTAAASFGIKIVYTPSAGQPSPLPNSGLITLTSGGISMS